MPHAQREKMQRRITEIAGKLFRENGYGHVSMRAIAKELDCTPMTLYRYYDAKIDILKSLWSGVIEDVFANIAACPRGESPRAHLTSICIAYVQYWLDHRDNYRLVFMAEGVMQPDVSLFLGGTGVIAQYTVFTEAIADLSALGGETTQKVKLDFLISALHGIAHNMITISGYEWSSAEAQISYVIAGISRN